MSKFVLKTPQLLRGRKFSFAPEGVFHVVKQAKGKVVVETLNPQGKVVGKQEEIDLIINILNAYKPSLEKNE